MQSLDSLPIPNKNMIRDSKILQLVNKWSEMERPHKNAGELVEFDVNRSGYNVNAFYSRRASTCDQ